jgi:hypothetical protein
MMDLFVALTPLALLPITLLWRFVGCSSTATGTGPVFRLNMDPDFQTPMPSDARKVKRITVFWSIFNSGGLLHTVPKPAMEINPHSPPFLDPAEDTPAVYPPLPTDTLGANQIACTCDLLFGMPDGSSEDTLTVHSSVFPLDATNYIFTLTAKPNAATGKRDFEISEYSM